MLYSYEINVTVIVAVSASTSLPITEKNHAIHVHNSKGGWVSDFQRPTVSQYYIKQTFVLHSNIFHMKWLLPLFLQVQFERGVIINSIELYETFNPGAVVNILSLDMTFGNWVSLWMPPGKQPTLLTTSRIFAPVIAVELSIYYSLAVFTLCFKYLLSSTPFFYVRQLKTVPAHQTMDTR